MSELSEHCEGSKKGAYAGRDEGGGELVRRRITAVPKTAVSMVLKLRSAREEEGEAGTTHSGVDVV